MAKNSSKKKKSTEKDTKEEKEEVEDKEEWLKKRGDKYLVFSVKV